MWNIKNEMWPQQKKEEILKKKKLTVTSEEGEDRVRELRGTDSYA